MKNHMKVKADIKPSTYILAGKDPSNGIIDFDLETLSMDQRKLLTKYLYETTKGEFELRTPGNYPLTVEGFDDQAIFAAINKAEIKAKEDAIYKEQQEKERMKQSKEALEEWLIKAKEMVYKRKIDSYGNPDWPTRWGAKVEKKDEQIILDMPEYQTWITDLNEAKAKKEKAAKEAKAKLEMDAKVNMERLKTWALKNGSQLLTDRIENGFVWQTLARQEFARKHFPPGFGQKINVENYEDRISPTPEELDIYKFCKQLAKEKPHLYANPQIFLNTEEYDEEYYDEKPGKFVTVAIDIICPDGSTLMSERVIGSRPMEE